MTWRGSVASLGTSKKASNSAPVEIEPTTYSLEKGAGMNENANEILLRIEQLLRGLLRAAVSHALAEIRADKMLREIWELTGKDTSIVKIAKKVKVSTWKISTIWQSWEEAGLLVKVGKSYQKTVD